MRVLITNHALAYRAGSELYVRDVAKELLRRGHTPIAYSTKLGDVALELRTATVPVVDDLAFVSVPPDIIHGQHHIETMSALLHFNDVPGIYFCHGWFAWEESPPVSMKRLFDTTTTCCPLLTRSAATPHELPLPTPEFL